MQMTFVRSPGAKDRIYVIRDDGSEVSWSFPSFGEGLPHDLVHLVVERHFGLAQGFWGRVAAGVDVSRINALANRIGGKDKYSGFGEDLSELLLAEALAGAPWSLADLTDPQLLKMITDNMARMGGSLPDAVTLTAIGVLRRELEQMRQRWAAQAPKGALKLSFP